MKKTIALALSVMMLLACAAAAAEETQTMGVLKMNKAFDITYKPLPDDYTLTIYFQDDMMILANIESTRKTLPRMGVDISFDDSWSDVERLNDLSEEELQVIRNSFSEEYPELVFETRETAYGTKLLIVKVPSGQEAYVYTIYRGHEIVVQMIPGIEQDALTDTDIERVVAFLSDMQFVPVE